MKDISNYRLVQPSRITKRKEIREMYDITVKDDHSFFVYLDEHTVVLTSNCDGHHISSLLINLFHRWFPNIIKSGKLYKLVTPLVVCDDGKERKYFQTLEEFETYSKGKKLSGVNYLKGLGSLSENDWDYVMKNKTLFQVVEDRSSNKFLDIAFGESSLKRKRFLEGK